MMKEVGATLPVDGVRVTWTPSIFHVRNAQCMQTLLLAQSQHLVSILIAFAVQTLYRGHMKFHPIPQALRCPTGVLWSALH